MLPISALSGKRIFIFQLPLFLILGGYLLFFLKLPQNLMSSDQFDIISNITFFNQTHVLLGFFLIFSLGHYSDWRAGTKINGLKVNQNLAVAFVLFFLLSQLFFFDVFELGTGRSLLIFLLIVRTYGTHHFLFQSYGFSSYLNMGYNLQQAKSPGDPFPAQLKAEYRHLKLIFISYLITTLAAAFLSKPDLARYFYSAIAASVLLALFAVIRILASMNNLPEALKHKKYIFCARYLLYPLKGLSLWLGFAALIIHACEYIYFVSHSFKTELGTAQLSLKKFGIFLGCELLFIVPLLFMNAKQLSTDLLIANWWPFLIVKGLVNALILCHFYLDSLAFSRKTNPHSHQLLKFNKISADLF